MEFNNVSRVVDDPLKEVRLALEAMPGGGPRRR
jgi:hypothetical protein